MYIPYIYSNKNYLSYSIWPRMTPVQEGRNRRYAEYIQYPACTIYHRAIMTHDSLPIQYIMPFDCPTTDTIMRLIVQKYWIRIVGIV